MQRLEDLVYTGINQGAKNLGLKERRIIIKLSPRLQAVAGLIEPGLKIADIGTDHAYLPIYLVEQNIIPAAVAIDIHQGPYESALKQVRIQGLADKISVRLGDGFNPVTPGEVQGAVLAGMGSTTMVEILEKNPGLVAEFRQLVMQPMAGAAQIRNWLSKNKWLVNKEVLVEDEGFIYIVIGAIPGEQSITDWLSLELGPIILKEKPPLLKPYVEKKIQDYKNILAGLEQARSGEIEQKKLDLRAKICLLKGVL